VQNVFLSIGRVVTSFWILVFVWFYNVKAVLFRRLVRSRLGHLNGSITAASRDKDVSMCLQ